MKLSQLFTGEVHIEENGRTSQTQSARSVADVNRQIHSLVPGQTIRGEIVSRNGSEIQIKLSDDMVLNARVDQSIHLETGKNVTFEVRNNGSTLSLSPLFTNVAADVNVLKALDMARLPVNETTVSMTKQLMEAGLPVNRTSLQQVYREINSFPENDISDVINLHKLQMPVNEANMQQIASYRNLTHQLINGLNDVLSVLPEAVNGMLAEGNIQGAAEMYHELFLMALEGMTEENNILSELQPGQSAEAVPDGYAGEDMVKLPVDEIFLGAEESAAAGSAEEGRAAADFVSEHMTESGVPAGSEKGGNVISAEDRGVLADKLLQTLTELPISPEQNSVFSEQIQRFGQGEMPVTELFHIAQNLLEAAAYAEKGMNALQKVFSGKEFQTVLAEQLKTQWTLQPEEVSQPGKVEDFYRRLDRQLKGLVQVLESGGQGGSAAYRAVSNVSQNVDFLNQLNQLYTYVQLPLHLQHSDAHGDLYVYTNKRSFAGNDGKVSALLHLDMEQLGPVDVYVTLQEAKVNTKFYVADDEILDFIEAHMELLTQRLQMRGYDCSCSMAIRAAKEEESAAVGGLKPLLGQDRGVLLSQYAFDVRT